MKPYVKLDVKEVKTPIHLSNFFNKPKFQQGSLAIQLTSKF